MKEVMKNANLSKSDLSFHHHSKMCRFDDSIAGRFPFGYTSSAPFGDTLSEIMDSDLQATTLALRSC